MQPPGRSGSSRHLAVNAPNFGSSGMVDGSTGSTWARARAAKSGRPQAGMRLQLCAVDFNFIALRRILRASQRSLPAQP